MTWTYDGSAINTDMERVRVLVGDTDTNDQLLQDEEIDFSLTKFSDVNLAAGHAARMIAAKLSRRVDRSIGKLRVGGSKAAQMYMELAESLESQAYSAAEVFIGGQSIEGKRALEENTDLPRAAFSRHQFSHPSSVDVLSPERGDLT